jgi:hypothetical protein
VGLPTEEPLAWLGAASLTAAPQGGTCDELRATTGSGQVTDVALAPTTTRLASCAQPRRLVCVQAP